jgi:carbonic anhydrase
MSRYEHPARNVASIHEELSREVAMRRNARLQVAQLQDSIVKRNQKIGELVEELHGMTYGIADEAERIADRLVSEDPAPS